jgi:hypothetical protein
MVVKWRKLYINFEVTFRIRNSFHWTLGSLWTVFSTCLHFLVYSYIERSLSLNSQRCDLLSAEVSAVCKSGIKTGCKRIMQRAIPSVALVTSCFCLYCIWLTLKPEVFLSALTCSTLYSCTLFGLVTCCVCICKRIHCYQCSVSECFLSGCTSFETWVHIRAVFPAVLTAEICVSFSSRMPV